MPAPGEVCSLVAAIGVDCLAGDEAGVASPFCASGVAEAFDTGEGEADCAGVAADFGSGVPEDASDSPGFEPTLSLVTGAPPLAALELDFPELEFGVGLVAEGRVAEFLLFVPTDEPFFVPVWLVVFCGDNDLRFESAPEVDRGESRALDALASLSPGRVKTMSSLFPRCST